MRSTLLNLGVSQLSAGFNTEWEGTKKPVVRRQSPIVVWRQHRHQVLPTLLSLVSMITGASMRWFVAWLSLVLPSFCTACYRRRTGSSWLWLERADSTCLSAQCPLDSTGVYHGLRERCYPAGGEQLIAKELETLSGTEVGKKLEQDLKALRCGRRDIYY